jgi:S-formylglutathione hydrolase FrmB
VLVHRVLGATVLSWIALCAPAAAGGARIVSERAVPGPGIELTIATPAFTTPTKVQVFLPAGYDTHPRRRWPVTYYLHGAEGDSARFHAWFGDLIKTYTSLVVAPDGGPVGFYTDWYNAGAGGPPMYETYDVDQLIPLIDQRFRTLGHRRGRAVIGESMGGYGVLAYAARHPDLFAAAASLSGLADNAHPASVALMTAGPPVQGGGPAAIYGERTTNEIRWRGHNPVDLADNLRGMPLQVRTFDGAPNPVVDGGPDSAVGCAEENAIHETNLTLEARLVALKISHVWRDYGAGCHDIPHFRQEFTDSLPGLLQAFAQPRTAPRSFRYRSIEPHFAVWRWHVDADPERALEFLRLDHAGRRGFTLVGSGATRVRTPPFFRRASAVRVMIGDRGRTVRPGPGGRLHLLVDLGTPHPDQQDTSAATDAGDGKPGYFTRRTVRFARVRPARR